jgi:hypothetical protein
MTQTSRSITESGKRFCRVEPCGLDKLAADTEPGKRAIIVSDFVSEGGAEYGKS